MSTWRGIYARLIFGLETIVMTTCRIELLLCFHYETVHSLVVTFFH